MLLEALRWNVTSSTTRLWIWWRCSWRGTNASEMVGEVVVLTNVSSSVPGTVYGQLSLTDLMNEIGNWYWCEEAIVPCDVHEDKNFAAHDWLLNSRSTIVHLSPPATNESQDETWVFRHMTPSYVSRWLQCILKTEWWYRYVMDLLFISPGYHCLYMLNYLWKLHFCGDDSHRE